MDWSVRPPRRARPNPNDPPALAYFVTLIVKDRACLLAEVVPDDIQLTEYGRVVQEEWFRTALVNTQVRLDDGEFVVMPNHVHGLIRLIPEEAPEKTWQSLFDDYGPFNRPLPNILPGFIRMYKAAVSQRLAVLTLQPSHSFWERSYEEQLVHGEATIKRIRHRIQLNQYRWETDPLHPSSPSAHPL